MTRGKEGLGEGEEGKEGINGDGRTLHLGCEHAIRHTEDVL